MKKRTGQQLAKEIGCTPEHLQKTFQTYNAIAEGKQKDPWGKRFFHNMPLDINDDFHVALMEPVLHFTMGGIEINDKAQVLNKQRRKPSDFPHRPNPTPFEPLRCAPSERRGGRPLV
jgi:succinate dehydrogenase/fumarate reductase flavoprotein subunit